VFPTVSVSVVPLALAIVYVPLFAPEPLMTSCSPESKPKPSVCQLVPSVRMIWSPPLLRTKSTAGEMTRVALQLDRERRRVHHAVRMTVHERRDGNGRERVPAGDRVAERVAVREAMRQRAAVRVDEVDVVGAAAVVERLHVRDATDGGERLGRVDLVARERLRLRRVVGDGLADGERVAAHGDRRARRCCPR